MVKKIGILTSGGDAPGMNAAIRSVTRAAIQSGLEVYGIHDGYLGLCEGKIERLYRRSVSETISKGGTFLGTARLPEFKEEATQELAIEELNRYGIDALVVIGGDGTYRGALALAKKGIKIVGIPGTIDNDIAGTDYTIGFDTALNTAVEAVDKLRDTSSSHRRCSIVEVMGRNCGAIAVHTGLAVGAEIVVSKETGFDLEAIIANINQAAQVKRHAICIVTEKTTDLNQLAQDIRNNTPFEARVTILGHIQRGGTPTARDRVLASTMGVAAVRGLLQGKSGVCVCEINNELILRPIEEALLDVREQVTQKYEDFKLLW